MAINKPTSEEVSLSREVFSTDLRTYLPDEHLGRDSELEELVNLLSPAARGQIPRNGVVIGGEGQGKSSCVMHLLEELRTEHDVATFHIDCSSCDSEWKIYRNIADRLQREQNLRHPIGRDSQNKWKLHREIETGLSEFSGNVVFVLDGLNTIDPPNDLLLELYRMDIDGCDFGTICITRNSEFIDRLTAQVYRKWSPNKVEFPEYSLEDLISILSQRVEQGQFQNDMSDAVIQECAEAAEDFGNSARAALTILSKSAWKGGLEKSTTSADIIEIKNWYSRYSRLNRLSETDLITHSVVLAVVIGDKDDFKNTTERLYTYYQFVTEESNIRKLSLQSFENELEQAVELEILSYNTDVCAEGNIYTSPIDGEILLRSIGSTDIGVQLPLANQYY